MKIIEYNNKYLEDIKDLLTELEEYIVSIDKDNLDVVHPEYHEKMALVDLEDVNKNNGKCYIAIENGQAIVEDVKGKETEVFKLKRKLFEKKYPDLELNLIK